MRTKHSASPFGPPRRLTPVLTGLISLLGGSLIAADVTSTWTSAASGVWDLNTNWTNLPGVGGFPNNGNGGVATYDAIISAAGAPYTVNLGTNIAVEDLTLNSANATLNHTTGTFTATGAVTLSAGNYQLSGGTISNTTINLGGGSLVFGANQSSNLLSGVTVNGELNLNATSAVTRIGGGTTFTAARLGANAASLGYLPGQTLNVPIFIEGAAGGTRVVEMTSAGSFTIGAAGSIRTVAGLGGDGTIGGSVFFGGQMTLANGGLISSAASGRTLTIAGAGLTNAATGIIEAISGGVLTINSTSWSNAGTVRVLGGSTGNLNGAWSNLGGTITTDGTSTLNLGGSFATPNLGTLALAGGSTVNVTGSWDNSGQNFTFNNASGSWTLRQGTISGGSLSFADGQNLFFGANQSSNLLSGVTVNGELNLNATSAVTRIGGGTTFTAARLGANAASLGYLPGQTLNVPIFIEGAAGGTRVVEMTSAGSFTIGAAGSIRTVAGLGGDGTIGGSVFFGGQMTLANGGLISSAASGRTLTIAGAGLTNAATGIIEAISGGVLTINSTSWSNAGTVRVLGGSTGNLNGAWSNLGGTITTDGTSTLNLGGSFATPNLGTLALAGGSTVNVTGSWDNSGQNFTFNNASGSWTLRQGTISGGSLSFADGQNLFFGANQSSNLLSGVTVNGELNLNATSAVTRIGGGTTFTAARLGANAASLGYLPGQTLNVPIFIEGAAGGTRVVEMTSAGSFTIGAAGSIRTVAGLGGDGTIGGSVFFGGQMTLANGGLISSAASGRTLTIAGAGLTNAATGIIEAISGGVLTINSTSWSNAGTVRVLGGSTGNLNGAWSNLGGTITTDGTSTLNLGGSFATPNLGTLALAGGSTVNVTGSWDNSGQNFTFNNASGSWTLRQGTISGGSLSFADGQNLFFGANQSSNLLSGVTVNGELNLNATSAVTRIGGGTTFTAARLGANAASLGYLPGQTLNVPIFIEGAAGGTRVVEMTSAGSFTIGAAGSIRTVAGLGGDGTIGGSVFFGGQMTLANGGLISSAASGRTLTIAGAGLTNAATGIIEAISGGVLTINSTSWSNAGTVRVLGGSTGNLNGAWSNLGGTITTDGTSTLNLGGSFATPNLGTLALAGGSTVNVTGSWDNSGQNFTFNNASGSWTLRQGTISGGSLSFADGQNLFFGANQASNLLSGVTVNGELNLNATSAVTRIGGGTTFTAARLGANAASLGYLPGQTLNVPIFIEGAAGGTRVVEMTSAGSFTIGAAGSIRTVAGLGGDGTIGGSVFFGGQMTLANGGLISSAASGRTLTIAGPNFTNTGTVEAIDGGILNRPGGYTQTAGVTRVSGGTLRAQTGSVNDTIQITGGSLQGHGSIVAQVSVSGVIDPTAGTGGLVISGDLSLSANTEFRFALGGTTQGTQFDFLSEAGTIALTLGGTLNLTLVNGFIPATSDTFTIITSNQAIAGQFSNVVAGRVFTSDGVSSFGVSVVGNNVVLNAFVIPEPSSALLVAAGLGILGLRRKRRA